MYSNTYEYEYILPRPGGCTINFYFLNFIFNFSHIFNNCFILFVDCKIAINLLNRNWKTLGPQSTYPISTPLSVNKISNSVILFLTTFTWSSVGRNHIPDSLVQNINLQNINL